MYFFSERSFFIQQISFSCSELHKFNSVLRVSYCRPANFSIGIYSDLILSVILKPQNNAVHM